MSTRTISTGRWDSHMLWCVCACDRSTWGCLTTENLKVIVFIIIWIIFLKNQLILGAIPLFETNPQSSFVLYENRFIITSLLKWQSCRYDPFSDIRMHFPKTSDKVKLSWVFGLSLSWPLNPTQSPTKSDQFMHTIQLSYGHLLHS